MKVSIRDAVRRHPEGITISLVILISLAFAVITQGGWLSIGNLQSISQVTAVLATINCSWARVPVPTVLAKTVLPAVQRSISMVSAFVNRCDFRRPR
jgi:predicted ABC-type sugar transport system permease subunit